MVTSVIVDSKGFGNIDKDPNATLDYLWDWSVWLADISDTIASVTFPGPTAGLVVASSDIVAIAPGSANGVRAWISGGNPGETGTVTCRIVTAGARTEDRTIKFKVRER